MIIEFLREFHKASRKEIDDHLRDKLSEVLDDSQKKNKIANLLSGLRIRRRIYNAGSRAVPEWRILDEQ